jgi:hypothetical protein
MSANNCSFYIDRTARSFFYILYKLNIFMNIDMNMLNDSIVRTDERKNMKTVNGDVCRSCIMEKEIPTTITLNSSELRVYPPVDFIDTHRFRHIHDMNVLVNTYACNRGHCWTINISMNKCWCIAEKIQSNDSSKLNYLRSSPMARPSNKSTSK